MGEGAAVGEGRALKPPYLLSGKKSGGSERNSSHGAINLDGPELIKDCFVMKARPVEKEKAP